MTIRKRRTPSPAFRLPPPYESISGEHAALKVDGVDPFCALMQVAAEDTHADYVICRGYDTRTRKFTDYEAGNADKPGFAVAKPYGKRRTGLYEVAQVFPALLPLGRKGQNPGVAADSSGHPADLDEEVEILYTDEGIVINWLLLDDGSENMIRWGIALADWVDVPDSYVWMAECDRDGTNQRLPAFPVYLPRSTDQDPAIFTGYVIGWAPDESGARICVTDYMDDLIGTLRMVKTEDAIPGRGWRECDGVGDAWDFTGRVPMGRDEDGPADEDVEGDTGGYSYHGPAAGPKDPGVNNHDDHPEHSHTTTNVGGVDTVQAIAWGTHGHIDGVEVTTDGLDTFDINWGEYVEENGVNNAAAMSHTHTDNRMRYKVVIMIERFE